MPRPRTIADITPYVPPTHEGVWHCPSCGGHLMQDAQGRTWSPMGASHDCAVTREHLRAVRRYLAGEL